jgi:23S rRNA (guanosine2251-2'-O)-methyltransferase
MRPKSDKKDRRHFFPKPAGKGDGNLIYGLHAVQAALANPNRKISALFLTERAAGTVAKPLLARAKVEITDSDAIARLLPAGAVHQGIALQCAPLPRCNLEAILDTSTGAARRVVLVLDQITDPQNVGAILRTAAAFGVCATVVQDRHAPPQSGALAKAASGALDMVPYVEAVNISRTLEQLGARGFWRVALTGDGEIRLADAAQSGDVALVLGSEGAGIRRLVREHCDVLAHIPIARAVESLNVSNAAAIALYELRRGEA